MVRNAIREARLKEIKQELLVSDKLKKREVSSSATTPNDLEFPKHDKRQHPTRVRPHVKHIPKYLIPKVATRTTAAPSTGKADGAAFVPVYKCRPRVVGASMGKDRQGMPRP
ncbi:hypothetical protein BJV77DRAFT_963844 [Russula vinacea]|nr:hypothetical protein BJV77DRAFT_963844 [Russula vinacea]